PWLAQATSDTKSPYGIPRGRPGQEPTALVLIQGKLRDGPQIPYASARRSSSASRFCASLSVMGLGGSRSISASSAQFNFKNSDSLGPNRRIRHSSVLNVKPIGCSPEIEQRVV